MLTTTQCCEDHLERALARKKVHSWTGFDRQPHPEGDGDGDAVADQRIDARRFGEQPGRTVPRTANGSSAPIRERLQTGTAAE